MKYILLIMLCCTSLNSYSIDPNAAFGEAQLATAKSAGSTVYYTCILTPPVTTAQELMCDGLYSTYKSALSALNAPYPILISSSPSIYSWSPYDICRYEGSHFVFPPTGGFPICIATI